MTRLPSGWLVVEGIRFRCIIGVNEDERGRLQELVASLSAKVDFDRAGASDSIRDTADYRALAQALITAGEATRFQLLESLASHLARSLLTRFPAVEEVRVEVEKPGALADIARSVRAIASAAR